MATAVTDPTHFLGIPIFVWTGVPGAIIGAFVTRVLQNGADRRSRRLTVGDKYREQCLGDLQSIVEALGNVEASQNQSPRYALEEAKVRNLVRLVDWEPIGEQEVWEALKSSNPDESHRMRHAYAGLLARLEAAVREAKNPKGNLEAHIVHQLPADVLRRGRRRRGMIGGAIIVGLLTGVVAWLIAGWVRSPRSESSANGTTPVSLAVLPSGGVAAAFYGDQSDTRPDFVRLQRTNGDATDVIVGNLPSTMLVAGGSLWVLSCEPGRKDPCPSSRLDQIDPESGKVNETIALQGGKASNGGIVATTSGDLLVADPIAKKIFRVDTVSSDGTRTNVSSVDAGGQVLGLAISRGVVWITYGVGSETPETPSSVLNRRSVRSITLSQLETTRQGESISRFLTPRIIIGRGQHRIVAIDDAVWVSNGCDGTVQRIDEASMTAGSVIAVGRDLRGLFGSDGTLWIASHDTKAVVNVAATGEATSFAVPGMPRAVAVSDGRIYVAQGNEVSVLDSSERATPDATAILDKDCKGWQADPNVPVHFQTHDGAERCLASDERVDCWTRGAVAGVGLEFGSYPKRTNRRPPRGGARVLNVGESFATPGRQFVCGNLGGDVGIMCSAVSARSPYFIIHSNEFKRRAGNSEITIPLR